MSSFAQNVAALRLAMVFTRGPNNGPKTRADNQAAERRPACRPRWQPRVTCPREIGTPGKGGTDITNRLRAIAMAYTLTNLTYHTIFSTKDRRPLIRNAFRDRLFGYIGGILDQRDGRLIRAGGTADHVHLLFRLTATKSIAEIMRAVKAISSKWIHETYPDDGAFAWQSGYAAFTVSQSAVPKVAAYIEIKKSTTAFRHLMTNTRSSWIDRKSKTTIVMCSGDGVGPTGAQSSIDLAPHGCRQGLQTGRPCRATP